MSKIFICCGTLESGGAERVLSVLSTPLADKFGDVTYITWRDSDVFYEIDRRVKIISLPRLASSNRLITKMIKFRKLVKKESPDIVISFLTPFNLLTLASLIMTDFKCIVAERNDPNFIKGGRLMSFIRRALYSTSDGILCQTENMASFFDKKLSKKTQIIYNPLFLKDDLIGKAFRSPKRKKIVSVGRLDFQKNQELLIRSFAEFHNIHPDYTLTIYGEGALRSRLESLIDELKLTSVVFLPGSCKDLHSRLLDAEIFIMTSRYEGMPNALIEAMALGLPCVSTKVSGATDLVITGTNGLLIDSKQKDIINALTELSENRELRELISQNAIKIKAILDPSIIISDWISYIESFQHRI